jgi:hypothetical protein
MKRSAEKSIALEAASDILEDNWHGAFAPFAGANEVSFDWLKHSQEECAYSGESCSKELAVSLG